MTKKRNAPDLTARNNNARKKDIVALRKKIEELRRRVHSLESKIKR